ncbi:HAD family hydrolase [Streptomyces sp. NPDC002573]|uniref:HAD family hydrolase n=1 Tax=Streptomyces sp. NPDC002573 TaxID=3364651 RepID=UPI0036C66843
MLALFDLDDTLIDRQGGLDAWAGAFAHSRGLPDQAAAHVTARLRDRAAPEDFDYLRDVLRLTDGAEDLWREYVDGVTRSVHCFPGVLEGLQELRREGWRLGIATNGAVDIQSAKLDATGLAGLFDGVAISESVGARKPERALFDAAVAICGVPRKRGATRTVPIPPVLVHLLREHIARYGTADDGRLFRAARGGRVASTEYCDVWERARKAVLSRREAASALAAVPYSLRHAGVSLWIKSGVDPAEVAARAGHSIAVLYRFYAKILKGGQQHSNNLIARALDVGDQR